MSRTPKHNKDVGYGHPMPWIDMTGGPTLDQLEAGRWHPLGACSDSSDWSWFADGKRVPAREAMQTCVDCPVRRTCLASSLVFAEEFGVWGGIPPRPRAELLRRLARGESLGDVLDSALTPTQDQQVA